MSTSLLDAPIWHDPGTWIVLGISLLFIVMGVVMHHIIMKIVRQSAAMEAACPGGTEEDPKLPLPVVGESGCSEDDPMPPQYR